MKKTIEELKNEISENILGNSKLEEQVKNDITNYSNKYVEFVYEDEEIKDMFLENNCDGELNRNLSLLKIEKGNKLMLPQTALEYDQSSNALNYIYTNIEKDEHDVTNDLLRSICLMSLPSNSKNQEYNFLKYGIASSFANNVVGNDGEEKFVDEIVISSLLSNSLSKNTVLRSYFSANYQNIKNEITDLSNEKDYNNLISIINYNFENKNKVGGSKLPEIQDHINSLFINRKDISKECIERQEANIQGNDELMLNGNYNGLSNSLKSFQKFIKNNTNLSVDNNEVAEEVEILDVEEVKPMKRAM